MTDLPQGCQQFGCREPAETWCPLCRAFFCHDHDELYPRRRHDCLRGKADHDTVRRYLDSRPDAQ